MTNRTTNLRRRAARSRRPSGLAGLVLVLAALSVVAAASAAPPPWMYDESSYDVLTYSAWGRVNQISSAECTGIGAAGKRFKGATHGSFRCDVAVGGTSAGVVTFKALGPESLRVATISRGKFKPDRGIGAVPKGTPILQDFDAVDALQKNAWARAHKVARVLCYGLEPHRSTGTSEYYYAFSCATFDARDLRGAQVLVTAAGKNAVRVVRTLAR
jgi:hypothetical protein